MAQQIQRIAINLPPLFEWQKQVHEALQQYRYVVVVTAQQIGKTTLAVTEATDVAMQGGDVWWVAPDYSLTEPGYDILVPTFDQPPFNQIVDGEGHKLVEEYKQRKRFTFRNGSRNGSIQIKSAEDPKKLRGKPLDLVVMDEAAFMHRDAWHANLRHRLTVRHGRALFITNPFGKNWLWELWRLGDPTNPDRDPEWMSFQFSQHASPLITEADIENSRRIMPFRDFRREVLGEFVDDGGEVFIGVRAAASIVPQLPPYGVYNPAHAYVAGMDISAGRQDYSVIIVFDVTEMAQVAIFRFSEPQLSEQAKTLASVYDYWHPYRIEVEENAQGMFAIPEFKALGLPIHAFNTNWKSKGDLIQNHAAAIEMGRQRLLRDPNVIKEHEAMESDVAPGGTVRYFAPGGGYDDIVIASALAYRAATVREDMPQPGFLRGKATGLYDNRAERTYPGWNGVGSSASINRNNARKQANAGRTEREKGRY